MKNKKGFISMTLVYSFLTLFLAIMSAIMLSQTEKMNYINFVNDKVSEDMDNFKGKNLTLMRRMLEDNVVSDGSMYSIGHIANNSIGNGNGLYYIEGGTGDNLLTDENNDKVASRIYFYRGQVSNNNVIISKVSASSTTNYCFKIIRTNENGSIRMMYFGKASSGQCNTTNTGLSSRYDKYDDDNAFVGYMHGKAEQLLNGGSTRIFNQRLRNNPPTLLEGEESGSYLHTEYQDTHNYYTHDLDTTLMNGVDELKYFYKYNYTLEYYENSSEIKTAIEKWYADNLASISSIIADSIFCTDRSVSDEEIMGYSNKSTMYRKSNYSFLCPKEEDRLSLSIYSGGSNSAINSLDYPVGLATINDIVYAGGSVSENNTGYYLYTGNDYWTMTPNSFDTRAKIVTVDGNGRISNAAATASKNIYPVISIKPDVVVKTGKGTKSNPYVIVVSETPAS